MFTLDHTGHIQIHRGTIIGNRRWHKTIDDVESVEKMLAANGEVRGYAPRVHVPALAYAGNKMSPVSVIGVDPELEPTTSRLREKVQSGRYFGADTTGKSANAMIGAGVARSLEIAIGDEIVLISQGADGSIANDIYSVSALVGNRTSSERLSVYLPLATAQEFLSLGKRGARICVTHRRRQQ